MVQFVVLLSLFLTLTDEGRTNIDKIIMIIMIICRTGETDRMRQTGDRMGQTG